ncbi:MAG TPA: hypothetical protein VGA36_04740, partial [Nitriliruptorales bacterium]
MPTLDDRLLPVFARQHWLVSMADIEAADGTAAQAARRVQAGRWGLADVNVYRLLGVPSSWHSRQLAPILSIPGGVASHFAAGALHGIDGIGRGTPELSIPRGQEHRRRGMRLHTSTDLDRCRVLVVEGIPTTDIDRTLLDLGRRLGDLRLLRAIEWARREDRTDWSSLIRTLAAHARRGRPGIRRLRRIILANAE